jgi:DNA end-binding protein Ku
MANTLVDMLKGDFKPEEFADDYRVAMMSMIEAKMQGQEVVEAVAAPTETKVIDLMEALKQSVEAARKAG